MSRAGTELIDGTDIGYGPGRLLECRAIQSIDDPTPFNFLEHLDAGNASSVATGLSRAVANHVLETRRRPIDNMLPLPDLEKSTVASVYEFVTGLGMEPYGRLAYIEDMLDPPGSGFTEHGSLTSYVIKSQVDLEFDESFSEEAIKFINGLKTHGVAVHELTHLAGLQDKIYFTVDTSTARRVAAILPAEGTLQEGPRAEKGNYLEEGVANLAHSMYFWKFASDELSDGGKFFRSPRGGRVLRIPERISNTFTGHHEYTHAAWGVERLVAMQPKAWDILMASRKYGAKSSTIRRLLKKCFDEVDSRMFDVIDNTDIHDLDAMIDTTARIDHQARKLGA